MAKSRPSGAGFVGFADPNVTKIEWYRGYTTKNPLQLDDKRLPHALHKKLASGEVSVKNVIDEYRASSNGRLLHAQNVPYDILFSRGGVKHDFLASNKSRTKLSILSNHDSMDNLLSKGTVLEKRVKTTNRYGKESLKKKNWERYWEVKGSTYIGDRLHAFSFSLVKLKGQDLVHVYDFSLRKRYKK